MSYPVLEIHHISVSAGDATLIAARDSEKDVTPKALVLIDAGQNSEDLKMIETHWKKFFPDVTLTHFILSHAHEDHFGYVPEVIKDNSIDVEDNEGFSTKVRKSILFDEDTTTLVFGHSLKGDFPVGEFKRTIKLKFNDKSDPRIITLANGITLTNCCANGVPLIKGQKSQRLTKFHTNAGRNDPDDFSKFASAESMKDENDLSLAWLLEYKPNTGKKFRYFTAGDLSGSSGGGYTNIEADLLRMLDMNGSPLMDNNNKLNVDVLKATHHGSKFSSLGDAKLKETEMQDSAFLKRLNPTEIIIPCNNHHHLPYTEFVCRTIQNDTTNKKTNLERIFLVNEFFRRADGKYDFPLLITYSGYWSPKDKRSNILFGRGIQENKIDKYNREIKEVIARETIEYDDYEKTQLSDISPEKYFKYYSNFSNDISTGYGPTDPVHLPCFSTVVLIDGTYKTKQNFEVPFIQGTVKKARFHNELLDRIPSLLDKEFLYDNSSNVNYNNCPLNTLLDLTIHDQTERTKIMELYSVKVEYKNKFVLKKHNENEALIQFNKFLDEFEFRKMLDKLNAFFSRNKTVSSSKRQETVDYFVSYFKANPDSPLIKLQKRQRTDDNLSVEFYKAVIRKIEE